MMSFFTNDLRRNLIKILCLTVGLALGFVLIAKVYVETSYDTFLPDADRIYIVSESATQDGEYKEYFQTPGATAHGIKRYCPQVAAATRSTTFINKTYISLEDGRSFETEGVSLADSCHFDIFSRPIISGNPHEVLDVDNMCMIPQSLAEKIGGDVIGLRIKCPELSDDYYVTIGGVYEDYPINSSVENKILLSLPSIRFFSHDGRENWIGNDRYKSFVKLAKGARPEELDANIAKMLQDNVDKEGLELYHYNVHIHPFVGRHAEQSSVKTMVWILSLLAFIMLVSAGLNYVLVVLGQLGKRNKEMAVRKCYGTSNSAIFARIMGESAFFLVVSMALAVLLVYCFSDICTRLMGNTPSELFSTGKVWLVEILVCVGLLAITGAIPAWVYCRTPVAHAFHTESRSRKIWKLLLLSVQFFASGLLLCLLVLVGRQYRMLAASDMGFEYKNLGYANIAALPTEARRTIVTELGRLGSVESVSTAYQDFISKASGNNVWLNDNIEKMINVADFYGANPGIVKTMGLRLLQGSDFDAESDTVTADAIVEERFIEVLHKLGVEGDNIIGQVFSITEHEALGGFRDYRVRGVVENMRRGGFQSEDADLRSAVIFPDRNFHNNLYIRFSKLTPETLKEAQSVIDSFSQGKEVYVTPYRQAVEAQTDSIRKFGSAVIIACVMIIIIALIGLIGYTTDEVQHRAREIAIRKVNGTSAATIVRLFCKDVFYVALPSLILGGAAAIIIGRQWLSQFTDQVSLSPLTMILSLVAILVLLISVVILNSIRIACGNPVEYLRNE